MAAITPTRVYKDLDLSFGLHPQTKDVLKKVGVNAIKQSLKNLLYTQLGEGKFQPYKGSIIYQLLFEPLDQITIAALDRTIEHTIQNYEPRVTLNLIQIVPDVENRAVTVSIFFRVKGTNEPGTLSVTLKRVR